MAVQSPRARLRAARRDHPRRAAFAGVFASVGCAFLAVGVVLPVLPQYVRGPLGAGDVAVGIVVGAVAFTAVVGRPVGGRLADARGRRVVVVIGMLAASAAGFLYLLPLGVPGLVFARLVLGVGEGWIFTAGAAWVVDLTPLEQRGRSIAIFGLAVWGGLTVGPLVGELLKHVAGYDGAFVAAGVLPLLGAAIARTRPDDHGAAAAVEAPGGTVGRPPLVPRGVIRPGVSLSLANIGYGTIAAFVVLHLARQGVPQGAAVFTVFAASVVLGRLLLGQIPERLGPRRSAVFANWLDAAGLALLAVAASLPVALVAAALVGIGFSLTFPALALIALQRTGDAQRGAALGALTAFFDIGVGVGAPLAGVAASLAGGYPAAFWFAAACSVTGALVSASLPKDRSSRPPSRHTVS